MDCCVFCGVSLDGFIARGDGGIDWLDEMRKRFPPGEDAGFSAFYEYVDAIVMGRGSYDSVASFPEWPYDRRVIVLSRSKIEVDRPQVEVSAEEPRELVERLRAEGLSKVYVDGGRVIHSFLRDGLIDEITLTILPIVIGGGRPWTGALPSDIRLALMDSRTFAFGAVQVRYRVDRLQGPC